MQPMYVRPKDITKHGHKGCKYRTQDIEELLTHLTQVFSRRECGAQFGKMSEAQKVGLVHLIENYTANRELHRVRLSRN